jgi:hypothetical protein
MVNSYRRKHQTWHALCQKTPDVATCQIGNLKIIPGKLKISSGKINQRLPILDVSGTLENCRLLDQCIQFFSTLTLETIPGPLSIFSCLPSFAHDDLSRVVAEWCSTIYADVWHGLHVFIFPRIEIIQLNCFRWFIIYCKLYLCMWMYIYICVYIYIRIYTYICVCMYIYICLYIYNYIYICIIYTRDDPYALCNIIGRCYSHESPRIKWNMCRMSLIPADLTWIKPSEYNITLIHSIIYIYTYVSYIYIHIITGITVVGLYPITSH